MEITIGKDLLSKLPAFDIIAMTMDVKAAVSDERIKSLVRQYQNHIGEEYSLAEVLNIPLIKEARDGYKKLGKDPSHCRLACESLLRRSVKGKDLRSINNLADIGNVLSMDCMRSVAVLDYRKIEGNVRIRSGRAEERYEGLGRGVFNIDKIPVYEDDRGPFGNPTSDTERTAVTTETTKILLFIVCFGPFQKERDEKKAIELFTEYCSARNIEKIAITREG